jgi:Family of unknown function (DUF6152)
MKPVSAYLLLAAIVIAIFAAPPAIAHHAIQAEYEMDQTKSFTGVMTRFAMINPHCRWFFEEKKEDGTKVTWEMSGAGPGALRAAGLVRIFQTGQVYEVTFAPAKNGANVGRVRTMKGPDGKVITLFHEDPTNPLNQ